MYETQKRAQYYGIMEHFKIAIYKYFESVEMLNIEQLSEFDLGHNSCGGTTANHSG